MAISLRCKACHSDNKKGSKACKSCGKSFRKSENFNYRVIVSYRDDKGKQKNKTSSKAKNLEQAKAIELGLKEEIKEIKEGGKEAIPTLNWVWEEHIEDIQATGNRLGLEKEINRYDYHFRNTEGAGTGWGNLRLDELEKKEVKKWFREMLLGKRVSARGRRYAKKTIRELLAMIRLIYKIAAAEGYYSGLDPTGLLKIKQRKITDKELEKAAKSGKFKEKFPPYLNERQIQTLVSVCRSLRMPICGLMCEFSLYTGARLTEIMALEWDDDVDLDRRLVKLNSKNQDRTTNFRTQLMSNRAVDVLERAQKFCDTLQEKKGVTPTHVFPNKWGEGRKTFSKAWRNIADKSGLPRSWIFHTLRHTFATHIAQAPGMTLYDLQRIMGHKKIATTMIYVHWIKEEAQDTTIVDTLYSTTSRNLENPIV